MFKDYYQNQWAEMMHMNEYLAVLSNFSTKCVQCNAAMINVNQTDQNVPKCLIYKDISSSCCSNKCWEGRFCGDCTGIVTLFQHLMPNAKYVSTDQEPFDQTKMTALRIEALQRKGLFLMFSLKYRCLVQLHTSLYIATV